MLAELDDLFEGGGLDVGEVDLLLDACVLDHVLEQLRLLGYVFLDLELALVRCNQYYFAHIVKFQSNQS